MSRSSPKTVEHVVATVPNGKRAATIVSVSATDGVWAVDLWDAPLFPDTSVGARRCGLRLEPDQLRDVAAALISVADYCGAQFRETATPEELAALVEGAAAHNKSIVAAVASNSAVFLKAYPDRQPFRVYVGMPFIMAVVDRDGAGPGAFDFTCRRAALRIAKLAVLTVEERNIEHYHIIGNMTVLGDSGVIIETTSDQASFWRALLAVEAPDVTLLAPRAEESADSAHRVLQ